MTIYRNGKSPLPISYENPESLAFLNGDPETIGSRCISIDLDTDNPVIRKLIAEGVWQPDSFEFGPDTVWIGKAAGLAAAGHHLLSENVDGEYHFLPHSDFNGEISQSDTKTLFSYYFSQKQIAQADDSNEWVGTSLAWTAQSDTHALLKKGYWKTGSVAATKPITIKSYEGTDENGTLVFDQTYPASQFPANSEIETIEKGFIELSPGLDIYTVISSDENFSLLTNAAETEPWNAIDICIVRYDNFLQTAEWIDGNSWDSGDYFINSRKVYKSNITGVQPGTFESNSDKWSELASEKYVADYVASIQEVDPVFALWDKSSGISITESQISDLQDYLTSESDPVFLAWDKSEGISITESQISDLQSYLTSESDPVFNAWDKSSGISITMSQISDLSESDPVFSLWDKSTGISIEESQISDLQAYLLSETDPIFMAWDRSTGISITESQISDLAHTPAFNGDIAEIYNSGGEFKIQPDAQGDVELFGDTDVGNDENSRMLYIRRQAAEGNDYIRFYISASRTAYIHASRPLTLQAQVDFTINSVTEDILFKVGDNAGVKKFYFRDSDNNDVVTIDSNGFLSIDANMGGALQVVRGSNNNIQTFMDATYTDIRFGGAKDYNRIGTWINKPFQIVTNSINRIIIDQYGRVEIPSSLTVNDITANDDILAYGDISARNHEVRSALVFDDASTQTGAGERHFSQGHTHTAIYNGDWYDASSENISERDLHFSPDGLMMYVIGLASGGTGDCSIWEYELTIPWDLSTVGTPTIESIETYGSNQVGLFIDADGRRLWTVCTSNDTVIEYSMSPWNISNLSWVQAKDISGQDSSPSAVFWSANGNRLFIAGDSDNDIVAFSITNEWDISGISWFEDFGTNIDAPTGLHFSSDGRRMYVMDGSAEDDIHEFHLSDPWRIGTARLVNLFDVSSENASPQGIFIVPDNSKIFMVGTGTPDGVYEYDLGLEINGAILANGGLTVGGVAKMNNLPVVDPSIAGVLWNSSGSVMVSAG